MSEQVKWFDYKGHEVPADSGAAMFVKGITYHALHAEAEALRAEISFLRDRADTRWAHYVKESNMRADLARDLSAAQGLLRDIYMTCNLREMPSEHAIRDISHQIKLLLTATPAPESADHMEDALAMVEQGERQEAVLIQAVAVTREDDEEGLRLEWLLEGGISELEFAGQVLFTMPEANDLCDEDGSAYLYRAPQPSQDVLALVEALEWYERQAAGCRKLTSEGDECRQALDSDGGKRAQTALASHRQAQRQA